MIVDPTPAYNLKISSEANKGTIKPIYPEVIFERSLEISTCLSLPLPLTSSEVIVTRMRDILGHLRSEAIGSTKVVDPMLPDRPILTLIKINFGADLLPTATHLSQLEWSLSSVWRVWEEGSLDRYRILTTK